MSSIQNFRRQIIELLTEDLAAALSALREGLPDISDKHAQVIALQARLKDANKERIRNTLSLDEYQRRIDTIRAECLDITNGLEHADFELPLEAGNATAGNTKVRQGSVLYRVPKAMPLRKPSICTIRVAMDEDALLEDIVLDDNVRLRGRVEVSDIMRAELLDPEGEVFNIRPLNEAEQLVRHEGYTQWLFSVTPRVEGEHQLLVKISMMEYNAQLGRYVPRDVSVLETVTIVTEPEFVDDNSEAPLKSTGERLSLGPAGASSSRVLESPSQEVTPKVSRTPTSALRVMALFLVFLLAGSTASWALAPQPTRDWLITRYVHNDEQAYQAYIDKYEDQGVSRVEDAYFRKTEVNPSLSNLRDYQRAYPDGQYRIIIVDKIQALEVKAIASLRVKPEAAALLQFVQDFPESERLPELRQLATDRPELLPAIEQAYVMSIQAQPTATKLTAFKRDFPQSVRLEEVLSAAAARPESLKALQSSPEGSSMRNPSLKTEEIAQPTTQPPVEKETDPNPAPGQKSGLTMVNVPGGSFTMGCVEGRDEDCGDDEKPSHTVNIAGFQIGKYEVTQADWRIVMGSNWSELRFPGCDNCPVENVSWNDIQEFLKKLNDKYPGKNYRLPTEAEWEYAARGGGRSGKYRYAGSNVLDKVAWYDDNSGNKTHSVGEKAPNELGLYDMSGNVYEWCNDRYGDYESSEQTNPKGPKSGSSRVRRGGSWSSRARFCRVSYRNVDTPGHRVSAIGFRLASSPQ
jgi:formylglycine-generating enzyme required for sulfatase activity